jgi:3-hydroxyacyl-CoA dehydrogenase
MGGGIAMCFANAGIPVRLLDATPTSWRAARADREELRHVGVARQPEPRAACDRALALITGTLDYARSPTADIVDRGRVRGHGRQAGRVPPARCGDEARRGAGTNTSTLDIDRSPPPPPAGRA